MWYKIISILDWFGEMKERTKLVKDFNNASAESFIAGEATTLLKLTIVSGDSSYKHEFSKFFGSGLRIKALSGKSLSRNELNEIADIILKNEKLVRRLISLGWDTLEVHDSNGLIGLKWPLKKFGKIGGLLN